MQNVPLHKKTKKRHAITPSLTLMATLFQLANKHSGINKVVNSTKNKEIPSIPKVKFKLNMGNQKNFTQN